MSQVMKAELDQVRTWLDMLHGDSPGLRHVCASGAWSGQFCENTEQVVTYVSLMDVADKQGIYLRATTLRSRPTEAGSRGGEELTGCLSGLWADIDIAGPGHKTDKPLPPDEEAARRIIEQSPLPEPTLWVHSGGGLYPWWFLKEPTCPEDLEYVKALSTGWHKIIAHTATELGYHYGTEASDLARVLRIPGTVNRKVPNDPKMCHLTEGGCGTEYSLQALGEAMAAGVAIIPTPEPLRPVTVAVPDLGDRPGDAFEAEPWDSNLLLHDWQVHHISGDTTYWTRPGKDRSQGWSATTGRDSQRDRLYVFSSSTQFEPHVPYSKFAAYCLLHHGGDYSAAAKELRRLNYGASSSGTVATRPDPMPVPAPKPVPATDPDQVVQGEVVEAEQGWQPFPRNDHGNAIRFATRYQDQVRRAIDTTQWVVYESGRWDLDEGDRIGKMAQDLADELVELEAGVVDDPDEFTKWAAKQHTDARLKAMVSQARGRGNLFVRIGDFDADPMLLNLTNGTLDLRTAQLRPHDPSDLLMEQAAVTWDPQAECPMWEKYLYEAIPSETERLFLQRVVGYSITGDTSEQAVFIHYGNGANGKSVFLDVIGKVLGSYSLSVDSSTLLERRGEKAASEDIARMRGKRFMRTSETKVGKKLNEGQVKLLAGGDDMVTARYLFRNSFDFKPSGKIHFATNHIPGVSNADSTWRRLSVIGWDVEFPEERQDQRLAQKILATERSGVLAWAVRGCLDWQQQGLGRPESIRSRTEVYRGEQDPLAGFLFECLKPAEPGHLEPLTQLWQVYNAWCQANGDRAMSGGALSRALVERGYERGRTTNTRGIWGVRAITPLQSQLNWQGTNWPEPPASTDTA